MFEEVTLHSSGYIYLDEFGHPIRVSRSDDGVVSSYPYRRKPNSQTVVERLICNTDNTENNIVFWAAEFGYVEIVEKLLQIPEVDPSAENNKALHRVATSNKKNDPDMIKIAKSLLRDSRVWRKPFEPIVQEYVDKIIGTKEDHLRALFFVGKTIGQGWRDVAYTIAKRINEGLNYEGLNYEKQENIVDREGEQGVDAMDHSD